MVVPRLDDQGNVAGYLISPVYASFLSSIKVVVEGLALAQQKLFINTLDEIIAPSPTSTAWPVANLAVAVPITVYDQIRVLRALIYTPTAGGTWDAGVYSLDGVRLARTAPQSTSGSIVESASLDVLLDPGRYYAVLVSNLNVLAHIPAEKNLSFGIKEFTLGSVALTPTLALADNNTRAFIPEWTLSVES